MMKRCAGVLLAVSSLPSRHGIGCLDEAAYGFVDWLAQSGQTYWQILPLGPTDFGASYDSPYQSYSAFAGNPYLINLEELVDEGVLSRQEVDEADFGSDPERVDYEKLSRTRLPLLRKAYERSNIGFQWEFQQFLRENDWWLSDYALFMALKHFFGGGHWSSWPEDIRRHWGYSVEYYHRELYYDVEFHKYLQFKFFQQWFRLKRYANERNIQIVGDIPIYVSPDSADVWAHPELFQLDETGSLCAQAGCPPDAFAADGQIWGNPLYRWDYHKQTDFQWWTSRLWANFRLYDVIRLDHFRGFDEYFAIPAGAQTAMAGHWEQGPGMEFFRAIDRHLGHRQFIAEDLGHMTDTVRQLVLDSGLPNMKVLQFAFDETDIGAANDYLPHNYSNHCWVYTGTHDNAPLLGWLESLAAGEMTLVRQYLDDDGTSLERLSQKLIGLAMMSTAETCVIPMQDYLALGNAHRMNTPGTVDNNWQWRMSREAATAQLGQRILELTRRYGRLNWENAAEQAQPV